MTSNITTIQVTTEIRNNIRLAAKARAKKMGISKLSMVDYLHILMKEQPKETIDKTS